MLNLLRISLFLLLGTTLTACTEAPPEGSMDGTGILAMGDSMMAWNQLSGQSIAHEIERQLGREVTDRSVSAASVLYPLPITGSLGLKISAQYIPGDWDWVVMNGGGNDLWLGCGCARCAHKMDRLISEDGKFGEIPYLVTQMRAAGSRVAYLGYLRTPGRASPIDACADIGAEFEARLTKMAAQDAGVYFVSNKDLVPDGDLTFHGADRVHPSHKGSAAIGARVANLIKSQPAAF